MDKENIEIVKRSDNVYHLPIDQNTILTPLYDEENSYTYYIAIVNRNIRVEGEIERKFLNKFNRKYFDIKRLEEDEYIEAGATVYNKWGKDYENSKKEYFRVLKIDEEKQLVVLLGVEKYDVMGIYNHPKNPLEYYTTEDLEKELNRRKQFEIKRFETEEELDEELF